MNEQVVLWIIGSMVTLAMGALGFIATRLWSHVVQCGSERRHVDARLASLEGDMNRTKQDIGTTDTGLRGQVHKFSTMCTEHEFRLKTMERVTKERGHE